MDKNAKYSRLLDEQIASIQKENRHIEFKSNYQDPDKLGQYISALSNGACLDGKDFGYLYFGVQDKTLEITGTSFDPSKEKAKGNQSLELYLRVMISPKINFSIEDFTYQKNGTPLRLVVFKIPAAVGQPTCFKQKSWIRVDSHTTDLAPYTERIRKIYNSRTDWTAQIIEDATIEDLDKDAIQSAREGYGQRFPDFSETLQTWNDATFLDKAGLTIDGKITRTAMLLVGKPEKAYKLGHIAQMDWKCFQDGEIIGQLFTIPFLKTTTELMLKIRNYRIKIYPHNSLIPAEIWKYDIRSILEGLHNCIAHQDYTKDERIIDEAMELTGITHMSDRLINTMSGGERQRVIIARALAQQPEILLMDEPTLHLDINMQFEVLDLVSKLSKDRGLTVVIVSHDLPMVARYCDRIILIHDRTVWAEGKPEDVLTPENMRTVFNIDARFELDDRGQRTVRLYGACPRE